ncbi:hypothetical protein OAI16_06645 [Flavobacteriaceae bacterium]|nr:hypothetical protein [Flavobacteriaceae bacterium]
MQQAAAGVPAGGGGYYPPTGTILSSFASPASYPFGLGYDGVNLISCDLVTNRIYIHSGVSATVSSDYASPSTNPAGLTYDGTNLISCDVTSDFIYVHDGTSSTILFSFAAPSSSPQGLAYDGTNLISCDSSSDLIYIHDGVSSTVLSSFASPSTSPSDLAYDGTNLISCDSSSDLIYVHDGVSSTILYSFATPSTNPEGLTHDGTNLISCDYNTALIYIHANAAAPASWTDPDLANASYDSVSFSFASQDASPVCGIFSADGTKMFAIGFATDTVYQYSLSTGFDLSTASYDTVSLSVAAQDTTPTGVRFDTTGLKMYIVGTTSDSVHQYSLSTEFDISTASYDSVSFSVASQQNSPYDLSFSTTGTKMYVIGLQGDTAYQYTLSTAWDISTASYDSVSFYVGAQEGAPMALTFNPDGNKMYVTGFSSDSVHQYSLSTGFDLSTASYDSISFSVGSQEPSPRSIAFKSDGSKMYITGPTDFILQYSTA